MTPTPETDLRPQTPDLKRSESLSGIARMLAESTDVRGELAESIRDQINQDAYLTDEKLELAIYRMLKDILT